MIAKVFERLMRRLFCGPECWRIHYRLHFGTGYIEGIHETYRALSKCPEITVKGEGLEIAKEIGGRFRLETGVIPSGCTIVSVERVW